MVERHGKYEKDVICGKTTYKGDLVRPPEDSISGKVKRIISNGTKWGPGRCFPDELKLAEQKR